MYGFAIRSKPTAQGEQMSNTSSTYTFDLVVKDDQTKDAIRQLSNELKGIGKAVNLDEATKQAQKAMQMFDTLADDTSADFKSISKAFARESGRAIAELEKQYAALRAEQEKNTAEREELTAQREKLMQDLERAGTLEDELKLKQDIADIDTKLSGLNDDLLRDQVKRNRQLRYQLKAAQQLSQSEVLRQKIEALRNKKGLKFFSQERKENKEQIKMLQAKLKLIEQEEQKQQKVTRAVEDTNKQLAKSQKLLANGTRLKDGIGIAKGFAGKVASVGKGAVGMIGGGIQAATQAAESQLDKERQSVRVKGFSGKDASDMLGELNIRTGADYSIIVEAINRVKDTMKDQSLSKDDLISAAEIELKYPGTSQAFASSGTEANMRNFNIYANRMRSIQRATGASDEQIAASTQMFANRNDFGNAKVTEMQSIYLGLQNSGAFDTQEELDAAFDRFVKKQRHSKEDVLVAASNFDWSSGIKDERNRTQADNLLKDKDWSQVIMAATLKDDSAIQKTDNEKLVEDMRRIEEQKNKLIMTLIPAVMPLVEELTKILEGDGAKLLAQGLGQIFQVVVPILLKVLKFLDEFVLQNLKKAMEWLASKLGKSDDPTSELEQSTPQNANGGIAWGTSIVGERGPEAIIPLDYSRTARAGNIVQNVAQTFNMSGNETTALSLAQAVSSRDFTRAMGKAAFKAGRLGAF